MSFLGLLGCFFSLIYIDSIEVYLFDENTKKQYSRAEDLLARNVTRTDGGVTGNYHGR